MRLTSRQTRRLHLLAGNRHQLLGLCTALEILPAHGSLMLTVRLQDKVGPFCRAASDCALILDAIRGRDTDDIASLDVALDDPFLVNISNLTLGVLSSVQDRASEVGSYLLTSGNLNILVVGGM